MNDKGDWVYSFCLYFRKTCFRAILQDRKQFFFVSFYLSPTSIKLNEPLLNNHGIDSLNIGILNSLNK